MQALTKPDKRQVFGQWASVSDAAQHAAKTHGLLLAVGVALPVMPVKVAVNYDNLLCAFYHAFVIKLRLALSPCVKQGGYPPEHCAHQ